MQALRTKERERLQNVQSLVNRVYGEQAPQVNVDRSGVHWVRAHCSNHVNLILYLSENGVRSKLSFASQDEHSLGIDDAAALAHHLAKAVEIDGAIRAADIVG